MPGGDDSGAPPFIGDDESDTPRGIFDEPSHEPTTTHCRTSNEPSLEPYVGKLERFELFQTNQSYYIIGCNKANTAYYLLKMDRTLIERPLQTAVSPQAAAHRMPAESSNSSTVSSSAAAGNISNESSHANMADATHNAKPTLRPLSDFLVEDPHIYTQDEIKDLLDILGDSGGGLKPIVRAYGIVGFVRFLDCYYLTLITRRAKVGSIGGNGIYTIKGTESFQLKPQETGPLVADADQHADPSSVLLSMWNRGKRSVGLGLTNREIAELRYQGLYQVVDLTKNFYFSYTYDLTRPLQENFLATTKQPFPPPPFKDMYAWNFFLTRELEGCTNSMSSFNWVLPIVHGAFVQRKLNDYGRSLNLVLIARRSRHFAGTRYLKRGVSEQGKVANDVEHEQILHDESQSASSGIFSSYLQNRGSIPTFWTQESSVTMPKPPIELNRVDPTYTATQLHFADLLKRYGSPLVVLDLVKQSEKREREVRVGNEYRHAIDYINTSIDEQHKIRYCALDYSHISKHRNLDVSTSLNEVATWAVNQTGFFCSAPKWKILEGGSIEPFDEEDTRGAAVLMEQFGVPVFAMEQRGVLRTNCIDCLDRTNVAQFSAGVEAIEQQLVVMGIRSSTKLDSSANIVRLLIDMYVDIGDSIALQYGGSEAHKKVQSAGSESTIAGPMGKHKELLTSIRRYYSNAFTDRLKQDAMNLFLGYYVPYRHSIPLWEMESDYYLHNYHVKAGKGTLHTMKSYQQFFGIDWREDEDSERREVSSSSYASEIPDQIRSTRPIQPATPSRIPVRKDSRDDRYGGESRCIAKVRERCMAQNKALSVWWKVAIQANIQQRMWMQVGCVPIEAMLPPRFDRLYQPEKIAQFDRFFARNWANPVRQSHSSQHSKVADDESNSREFRRNVSAAKNTATRIDQLQPASEQEANGPKRLVDFVGSYGLQPHFKPTLKSLIKHHEHRDSRRVAPRKEHGDNGDPIVKYLNRINHHGAEKAEYAQYVATPSQEQYRPGAVEEFQKTLHDFSLNADDVDGIRKLAESAHIGKTLKNGPYRGLSQNENAVEVATVIHEQFNALENMRSRGDLPEAISLVDSELKRRGLHASGVRDTVASGWESYNKAEKQYGEVINATTPSCRRSDLSTPSSVELYASMFDQDTQLSIPDLTFLLGRTPQEATFEGTRSLDRGTNRVPFVEKAKWMGIPMVSHTEIAKEKPQPLFQHEMRHKVPPGFEQINEDMFARKDNKFMVFNGVGVDSWNDGMQPITKTTQTELFW